MELKFFFPTVQKTGKKEERNKKQKGKTEKKIVKW